jgi:aconitate hydratase
MTSLNTFKSKTKIKVGSRDYSIFSLKLAEENGLENISKLPKSLKVLTENLLRKEDEKTVTKSDINAMTSWLVNKKSNTEISFYPSRVMMQDFTGVPAVVDLAAMRDAMKNLGGDPQKINPQVPVDLVIDHSVMVDSYGDEDSFQKNVILEFERNQERYEFLKWGQNAFENFRVVPPGTGIIHQVNLEYTGQVVWTKDENGEELAYCDSLVGTDSHTTMINGLSILGWGVGGIEAEAAMLGQAITMLIPEVVGFKVSGKLTEGTTATDLVLRVVEMLRQKNVVGKFVEFYGDGLDNLSLADRATIANMAPEYGATMGFFPIDEETIRYLKFTNRDSDRVALVEAYAKEQGLWRNKGDAPTFTDSLELDMGTVEASIAGPKRPQDRVLLSSASEKFNHDMENVFKVKDVNAKVQVEGEDYSINQGDVVIAAITSCTNTSNPNVMIGAGLVARKARELGLTVKPWVKTSLAPGSKVVTDYLVESGLQEDLDALGFNLVGYGCTTCIGNSGPLLPKFSKAIQKGDLVATSVLSGNRNFEGRISPDVKANYLASPPLVVAYALAGSMKIDITKEAIGQDKDGKDVFLKDLWPTDKQIKETVEKALTPQMFKARYSNVFEGTKEWQDIKTSTGQTYQWNEKSTYIQNPPFFEGMSASEEEVKDIVDAKLIAILADSTTTDHISPAGNIAADSPAGIFLKSNGVEPKDFNSYGSRRGNDKVMTRGTFANIRIKNEILDGVEGGYTKFDGVQMPIFDAAMKHKEKGNDLVVVAGKEYGTGSSRDWAAKGTRLQGISAVIVESFERIHRSNLIGMGVLPLEFTSGQSRKTLKLDGSESFSISGISTMKPGGEINCKIKFSDGKFTEVKLKSRIDTQTELEYFKNGGILHYMLRNFIK